MLLLSAVQAAALSFTFSLTFDSGDEEFNGIKLNNYGLHEMIDNAAYFTLRLPQEALYRFIIYAKDTDQEVGIQVVDGQILHVDECSRFTPMTAKRLSTYWRFHTDVRLRGVHRG
jgi:hypothetical protein